MRSRMFKCLFAGIAVLVVGWVVSKGIRGALVAVMRKAKWEETIVGFMGKPIHIEFP